LPQAAAAAVAAAGRLRESSGRCGRFRRRFSGALATARW